MHPVPQEPDDRAEKRRSARTPANGLASVGTNRATRTPPTAEALPEISTTRITSAIIETASPTNEIP